jgi:hypothetical protein
MIYKFLDGTRVHTATLANGATEFTTYNARREVISTVVAYGDKAETLRAQCIVADGIRFARVYGGKVVSAHG